MEAANNGHKCGLREKKKRETHRALHQAALRLVDQDGLDAVTAEQISAEAGVSARTFFNYFPTKEQAVLGYYSDFPSILVRAFEARPLDETPWDSVIAVSRMLIQNGFGSQDEERELAHEIMMRYPQLAKGMFGVADEIRQIARSVVTERLAANGMTAKDARRQAVVYIDAGMLAISTSLHLSRTENIPLDEAFQEVTCTLNSLGTTQPTRPPTP